MKGPKAENVETMFDSIARDYDGLNHLLSLDIDKTWRRRSLKRIAVTEKVQSILDVACGTGDFSIEIARHTHPDTVVRGIDLSDGMLAVMRDKVLRLGLDSRIAAQKGDCENMPFEDGSFDVVTIGFGIRNFEHREKALKEILRVLKPGGKLVILELSVPEIPVIRGLYKLYFTRLLPWIGGKVSGDASAYGYLPASVLKFPPKKEWMALMRACGYANVLHKAFSLGICRMYIGEKQYDS